MKNRLENHLNGPYFADFLAHSPTMDRRNRQNLNSLIYFFAFDSLKFDRLLGLYLRDETGKHRGEILFADWSAKVIPLVLVAS